MLSLLIDSRKPGVRILTIFNTRATVLYFCYLKKLVFRRLSLKKIVLCLEAVFLKKT